MDNFNKRLDWIRWIVWAAVCSLFLLNPIISLAVLINDTKVYVPPTTYPAIPAAGGTFIDPTFGTKILRVSDGIEEANLLGFTSQFATEYSGMYDTFSANSKHIIYLDVLYHNYIIADLDLTNLKVSNKRRLPATPAGSPTEAYWSHTDDDKIFVVSGMGIYRYSLSSNSYTLVKDLTPLMPSDVANLQSRGFSRDDNRVHLIPRNANYVPPTSLGPSNFVYDIKLDKLFGPFKMSSDKASLTGDGTMILSNDGVFGVDTGVMEPTVSGSPDFNQAHSDIGVTYPVIGDEGGGYICAYRQFSENNLKAYHTFTPCSSLRTLWDADEHYSLRDRAEDWVTITTGPGTMQGLFEGEIYSLPVRAATDSSINRRYAHHHSDTSKGYWADPHANVSQDGSAIAFGSTYNTSRVDLYLFATAQVGPPPPSPPVISGVSASNISSTLATISWTTNTAANSQIYYGTTSAYGQSSPLMDAGGTTTHSVTLSALASSTTYHFQVRSIDSSGNLTVSQDQVFSTPASAPTGIWYSSSWPYRTMLTVNHGQVSGAGVTNFPVLVSLTIPDLKRAAKSDGSDILFTDASGVKLSHELESFNQASGALTAWVGVPTLSSSMDTNLYIYYGNASAASQQNRAGAWDSNYKGVWHLNEASMNAGSSLFDSTANGNTMTNGVPDCCGHTNNPMPSSGEIGGAAYFPASSQYNGAGAMTPGNSGLGTGTNFTMEAWFNVHSAETYDSGYNNFMSTGAAYPNHILGFYVNNNNAGVAFGMNEGPATSITPFAPIALNTWYHVLGTYDGSNLKIYLNGTLAGSTPANLVRSADSPLYFGYGVRDGSRNTDVAIDEARISNTARTSDWAKTEYNNQNSPGSFMRIAASETYPAPPIISSVAANSLTSSGATISWTTDKLSDSQVDYGLSASYGASSALNLSLTTSHSIPIASLAPGTLYHYRVDSRDASGNLASSPDASFTTSQNTVPQKFPRLVTLVSLEGGTAIPNNVPITATVLSGTTTLETESNLLPNAGQQYSVSFLAGDPQFVNIRIKANGYLSQLLTNVDTTLNTQSPISVPQLMAGDLTNHNTINSLDYSLMNSHWLQSSSTLVSGDLNGDGIVNAIDFAILKNNFGKSGQ